MSAKCHYRRNAPQQKTQLFDHFVGRSKYLASSAGIRPSWHYFYLFMGSYLRGDMKEAVKNADHITSDHYAFGLVARAITASAAKDTNRARQAIDRLLTLAPAWQDDARGELARGIPDSAIIDRLLRDLTAAGLPRRS